MNLSLGNRRLAVAHGDGAHSGASSARLHVDERTWRRWESGESSPAEQKAAGYEIDDWRRADAHNTERRQRKWEGQVTKTRWMSW